MNNTGQICRSKKNAQSRYTMIDNGILQNWELSPEEKSILIYLLSMPENWIVIKTKLMTDSNIGRDRFNRAWKGLQEKGYVVSIRVIDAKTNQIKGWNHIVYEKPILPETKQIEGNPLCTEIPLVGNPDSRESRQSENPYVYKELTKQNTNLTKETLDKAKPKKGFVPPTLDELKSSFPEINAERFINYYESIGWMVGKNKMKSWEAAAAGWIARDNPKITPKTSKNKATLNDD